MLLNSKRMFEEVILTDLHLHSDNLDKIATLLNVHGSSINHMKVKGLYSGYFQVEARYWFKMFEMVPNLESLKLEISDYAITTSPGPSEPPKFLPKLRRLTLGHDNYNNDLNAFLDHLPGSLQYLKVLIPWDGFDDFINRQGRISELFIKEDNFKQLFTHLQLESFTVFDIVERKESNFGFDVSGDEISDEDSDSDDESNGDKININDMFLNFIKAHPNIQSVKYLLFNPTPDPTSLREDVLKAICHLPSLKELYLVVGKATKIETTDLIICKAKEVEVTYRQGCTTPSVKDILKMKNIRKLKIDRWDSALTSKPTLRHLEIKSTSLNTHNLNEILASFNGLKFLELDEFNGSSEEMSNDMIHRKLKDFQVNHEFNFDGEFGQFLKVVPNLKILLLREGSIKFSNATIIHLASMSKLKSLLIAFDMSNEEINDNALKALKKMCNALNDFEITFEKVPNSSHATFQELSSTNCNVNNNPERSRFVLMEK